MAKTIEHLISDVSVINFNLYTPIVSIIYCVRFRIWKKIYPLSVTATQTGGRKI